MNVMKREENENNKRNKVYTDDHFYVGGGQLILICNPFNPLTNFKVRSYTYIFSQNYVKFKSIEREVCDLKMSHFHIFHLLNFPCSCCQVKGKQIV